MTGRALVVDDDPAVFGLIQTLLGATGMEVFTLSRSSEAPGYLQKEKFVVAMFDLRMASPDGIELSRMARSSGLNQMTPIILLSDDAATSAVSEGFSAGASFFLYKPIDKSRLLKLIRAMQGAIEHERRRFRRIPLRSKVKLSGSKLELTGETLDISLNGLLVQTSGTLPKGSTVQITLSLSPDTKPLSASGCVMRVLEPNQMGIQLNPLPVAESARLQEYPLPMILREPAEARAMSSP
ncbi:MAG TPA: response regulator [Verrucomicrobiae bacterium]|nr:response regulator [Verrucomicrobiae bacterium]